MTMAVRSAVKKIADPFGHAGQAAGYAEFRPVYPNALLGRIAAFTEGRILAVDVATGTGQVAVPLATPEPDGFGFKQVIAFDSSEAQLSKAKTHPNVKYVQADAYAMPLADHVADLVTVAQAAHWFDMPRFLRETARVLRPGGSFAMLGYGICSLKHAEAEKIFKDYYAHLGSHLAPGDKGCYWDCDRRLLDNGMAGVDFAPFLDPKTVSREWFFDDRTLSMAQFDGYLRTWSGYRAYLDAHPDRSDIADALVAQLQRILGKTGSVDIKFPFFLSLARTPPVVGSSSSRDS